MEVHASKLTTEAGVATAAREVFQNSGDTQPARLTGHEELEHMTANIGFSGSEMTSGACRHHGHASSSPVCLVVELVVTVQVLQSLVRIA